MNSGLQDVLERQRLNAVGGWLIVGVLLIAAVADALDGSFVSAAFPLALGALVVIPPIMARSARAMLPWELVAVAALPVAGRFLLIGQELFGVTLTGRVTTYVAVAAVALILAVEIDVFTPVRMNHTFAVLFVVIATLAAAGSWAMLTWLSDRYLGTALMFDGRPEEVIEAAVMWDFVAATGVGLLTGIVFDRYVRGRLADDSRFPDHETTDLFPAEATAGPGGPDAGAGEPAADGGAEATAGENGLSGTDTDTGTDTNADTDATGTTTDESVPDETGPDGTGRADRGGGDA